MNSFYHIWTLSQLFVIKIMFLFVYSFYRIKGYSVDESLKICCVQWSNFCEKKFQMKIDVLQPEVFKEIDLNRPVFLVSNHESWGDIPALCYATQNYWGFVAKKELSRMPMLNYWMKKAGCILIDRKNFRGSLRLIENRVTSGEIVPKIAIFPEGTRSKDGSLLAFKPGGLKIAWSVEPQIIVTAVHGTRQAWENRSHNKTKPVKVKFLKKYELAEVKKEMRFSEWVKELRKELESGLDSLQKEL